MFPGPLFIFPIPNAPGSVGSKSSVSITYNTVLNPKSALEYSFPYVYLSVNVFSKSYAPPLTITWLPCTSFVNSCTFPDKSYIFFILY